jgi:hypothetical protein
MTEKFEDYLCRYFQEQAGIFKRYLLAALESKDQNLNYLDQSLGTFIPSIDIRNCELLTDAHLFREEIKLTRDGRNRYKVFTLTILGTEMAKQVKEESLSGDMPESPPMMPTDQTEPSKNE